MTSGPPPTSVTFALARSLRAVTRDVWASREVLSMLTRRLLRVRYAHHVLGVVWALVSVLIPLLVLLVLRRHIGRVPRGVSSLGFIASGLVCWQFFSTAVNDGATSLLSDSGILKRIAAPREVIPLSRVALAAITGGLTSAVFLAIGLAHGDFRADRQALVVLPVVAIGLTALAIGLALSLSVAVVLSRDLRQVVSVVLQFGIFYSPILFPLSDIPPSYRLPYVAANPVGGYIDSVRSVLVLDTGVSWSVLGLSLAISALALVLGVRAFRQWLPQVIDLA